LAEQIGKSTLERVEEGGNISFKASGKIDFFGDEALTRVGGAGGLACTVLPQANSFVDLAA